MITSPDYKKELATFASGVIAAYLIECLLGVNRSPLASPASAAGTVILFGMCRSSAASLYDKIATHKKARGFSCP
jgi:hypothetical protein